MHATLSKLTTLIVSALSLASIAGCAPEDAPLPGADKLVYSSELTNTFQNLLTLRDNDDRQLGLRRVVLSCNGAPGKIHFSVAFKDSKRNLPTPLASDTPCSETGTLVVAEARETRGTYKGQTRSFTVYSQQPYATSMVEGEWQKVLDATLGTFALNKAVSDSFSAASSAALGNQGVNRIRFKCDTASQVVAYTANYQQSWRDGITTVACPTTAGDRSELLATLELDHSQESQSPTNRYRIYSAQTVTSTTLSQLVDEVVSAGQPRNSF